MTKEMTSGSPMKLILGFSIPLLFGNLFQRPGQSNLSLLFALAFPT